MASQLLAAPRALGPVAHQAAAGATGSSRAPGRLWSPAARPLLQRTLQGGGAKGLQQRVAAPSSPPLPAGGAPDFPGAAFIQEQMAAAEPQILVNQVLEAIEGSDSGDNLSAKQRAEVDAWLQRLDEIGEARELRPLADPLVWGNYNVAYVSSGNRQYGQPAGGRFRGGLGKLIFKTTLLAQSVLKPDLVTNKLAFRLLGFIPGAVGLRGTFVSVPDREGGPDRSDTVKVFFEPPVLSLPGDIHIRTGPPSSVVLKTTYVDERVRLGKGSRGSLFVFTRGGAADTAGMDRVGTQECSPLGKVILWAVVAFFMLNGAWLASRGGLPPVVRAAGLVQVLLGTALGGVIWRGGIVDDNEDRPEVAQPAAAGGGGGDSSSSDGAAPAAGTA